MTRRPLCVFLAVTMILSFVLWCAPQPGGAANPPPADVIVRVGTWNIEWLGKPERRRSGAQKPEDLAKYIRASKVDLLSLNEISHDGDSDNPRTNRTLTRALEIIKNDTGQSWKHVLFPKEDRTDKDQLCGVAWNTARVTLVGAPLRVAVRRPKGTELWTRHPHAVKFSFGERKTDVVVIPVHMKSNVGAADATRQRRGNETRALVRSLGALQNHFTDDDLVILGDFNCLKKDELALRRYALGGFRDLNGEDNVSWIKSDRYDAAPFDRIFVPEDQPEFAKSSFKVFKDHSLKGGEAEFRRRLSDHYMVVTEVKVMDDDD